MPKKCTQPNCEKRAVYGIIFGAPIKCGIHREDDMTNVVNKRCEFDGCGKRPSYNYPDQEGSRFCATHKLDTMVDIVNRNNKCQYDTCTRISNFGYIGDKKGSYCSEHKLENMIDLKNKTCIFNNCKKQPAYGYETDNTPKYCKTHALDDMINIKTKKCIFEGCQKIPTYNYINTNTAIYCKIHSLPDMIDIKSRRCDYEGCMKQPLYSYSHDKSIQYCSSHKLSDMVNIKHQQCIYENCEKRAYYKLPHEKRETHCTDHRTSEMIDGNHKKCMQDGCMIRPSYNFKEEKTALYCQTHASTSMVNVLDKRCSLCNMVYLSSNKKKYDGLCFGCYCYTFPDNPMIRNHKTKENQIFSDLMKALPDSINIIRDSTIKGGCSRRRPDGLIQLNQYNIILEVDEDQHMSYDETCENRRIMELFQDLSHDPVVIIRFNPDKYKNDQNKTVHSLFKISKTDGSLSIANEKKYNDRLDIFRKAIEYHVSHLPERECTVVKLYYDGFDPLNASISYL
jgi:hypothetical protein